MLVRRPPAAAHRRGLRPSHRRPPPLCRALLGALALLTWNIEWMLVDCVGFALGTANLYGYIKCKKGASKRQRARTGSAAAP